MAKTFGTSIYSGAIVALLMAILALCGCSGAAPSASSGNADSSSAASATSSSAATSQSAAAGTAELAPGTYEAEFKTDSSMFHVNEAKDGMGELTVADDGTMTIHVSLVSKKIVNLFPGTASEAQQPDARLLEPTTDTVTYKDGAIEEVYGFDVPVPALDEEFDLALVGEKGTWYDHKVSVASPTDQ